MPLLVLPPYPEWGESTTATGEVVKRMLDWQEIESLTPEARAAYHARRHLFNEKMLRHKRECAALEAAHLADVAVALRDKGIVLKTYGCDHCDNPVVTLTIDGEPWFKAEGRTFIDSSAPDGQLACKARKVMEAGLHGFGEDGEDDEE